MRFLHAADLHIDSPLRGLQRYETAPISRLRHATRMAFENLVQLALDRDVAFVLLAGDLFDGRWRDMQTGIWTANQFRRLESAGIPVFLIQGNHDADSEIEQAIDWPGNVVQFAVTQPETKVLDGAGVALHGQGFAHRHIEDDVVADYPPPREGLFNIGLLHTSLAGDPEHDTYAPTTVAELVGRGYDYWALGHIHGHRVIRRDPWIVYPGNTQGRHIRETGAKGVCLVDVQAGEVQSIEFIATDDVRWFAEEVAAAEEDAANELLGRIETRLTECGEQADGRLAVVRITVTGATLAHQELTGPADRTEFIERLRDRANALDHEIWIEKTIFLTAPLIDLAQRKRGADLLGELLRSIDRAHEDADELTRLAACLKPLQKKAASELQRAGIDLQDAEQLWQWLEDAKRALVTRLAEVGE